MKKLSLPYFIMVLCYCCTLIVANIMAIKILRAGPFLISTAAVIFPLTYVIADCVSEIWGFSYARFMILCGVGSNIFFAVFISIAVALPTENVSEASQYFNMVLQQNPQIVIAAFIAFVIGSLIDSLVLCKMKIAYNGGKFFSRAIISTIIGELIDSLIFFPLAYWGELTLSDIVVLGGGEYCLKILFEIILFPFLAFSVTLIKKWEEMNMIPY